MIKRAGLWVVFTLLLGSMAFAQSDAGKISGKVTDEGDNNAPVELATVRLFRDGGLVGGANTDENGKYSISPVQPGTYYIIVSYGGKETKVENIQVNANKTSFNNVVINTGTTVETVVIRSEKVFEKDQTSTGGTVTGKQIRQSGLRNINTLAAIVPGVTQNERSGGINIRGGRSNSTVYYVDGVKVRGLTALPQRSIEQLTVITGGTPAEYGDMIGGVISITTAGPSYQLTGGGEIITSEFLDDQGYNLLALNLSGPLITKYDSATDYKKPVLGFFLAGEAQGTRFGSPSAVGVQALKDDRYEWYQENPLTLDDAGIFFIQTANFIQPDEIETRDKRINSDDWRVRLNARFDYKPTDNIVVKVGGSYEGIRSNGGGSLFARENGSRFEGTLFRGWARFQQKFETSEDSKLQNLFYTLQADYNVYNRNFMDKNLRDNVFAFGHVGEFDFDREERFRYIQPGDADHDVNISQSGYWQTSGFQNTNLTFNSANSSNPVIANYNDFIIDYIRENGIIDVFDPLGRTIYDVPTLDHIQFWGQRNGDFIPSVYSLYAGPGDNYGFFAKFNYEQYRLTGQATGEIGGHNIKAGFEFEQRSERFWQASRGYSIWNFMRQFTNRHLQELDLENLEPVYSEGIFQDTVHANILVQPELQSTFDRNLREKLLSMGLIANENEFIVTDKYGPEFYDLNMFSADELLNNGNYIVSYYGYDYTGNRSSRVAEENFFTDEANRPMNAFQPTYISGFIQDKFELEDIIFNVGVRVDRFDANQKVLRDPFVLFPTYSATDGHVRLGSEIPANIDGDWVPYVDNANDPTQIVGYRDPDSQIWYDVNGSPTSSSNIRSLGGGKVQPYVVEGENEVSIKSFEDYQPQTVVMPRLSFSFPISDVAVFFAHYDVLAQRPGQLAPTQGSLLAGQISDYYYLQNSATVSVTNSDLRPERTVDYEVGFKQKVGDNMALSISAFYREMRDMIQSQNFQDAYPLSYSTYNNIDFGTVKGFTLNLDMIRTKSLRMNASYTLQFANGTGSSFTSSRNAVNSIEGFSAIRTLLPLDYDQRHRFSGNVDYRFFGENKGPAINIGDKTYYPLNNAGANATFVLGSGTPYSVNVLPNPADVQGGVNQQIQLGGTPNGSRLPFQYRVDMRIDKDFVLGGKKNEETGKVGREWTMNVYLLALNVLNTRNIVNVYKTTGLPDDDGYLATGVGQQAIASSIDPGTFEYLYTLKMSNAAGNFSLPRRLRLGLQFSF